jgi:hypothetical protein
MEYSDEDSDYPEAPNEVNDENQNSPSYNAVDVPTDSINGGVINDGTIGVISKFRSEAYTYLPICPPKLLLSSFPTVYTLWGTDFWKILALQIHASSAIMSII